MEKEPTQVFSFFFFYFKLIYSLLQTNQEIEENPEGGIIAISLTLQLGVPVLSFLRISRKEVDLKQSFTSSQISW